MTNMHASSDTAQTGTTTDSAAQMLVDLVMNQDHVAQNWIKFLTTIEAGLAVAFAFSFGQVLPISFRPVAMVAIPSMAIVLAILLTFIVIKERQWQTHYVNRFNALPGYSGLIFPVGNRDDRGSEVASVQYGTVGWSLIILTTVIVFAWGCALFIVSGHVNELAKPPEKGPTEIQPKRLP